MSFKAGDIVTVYNQKLSGEPVIDGRARIIKPTGVYGQYKVKFLDGMEHGTYDRFVWPGPCQDDPAAYIAAAKIEWHESQLQQLRTA